MNEDQESMGYENAYGEIVLSSVRPCILWRDKATHGEILMVLRGQIYAVIEKAYRDGFSDGYNDCVDRRKR